MSGMLVVSYLTAMVLISVVTPPWDAGGGRRAGVHRVMPLAVPCRSDRVWRQLRRDGIHVGRKRVERLMRQQGWQGAFLRRGWRHGSTRQDPRPRRPRTWSNATSPRRRRTDCGSAGSPRATQGHLNEHPIRPWKPGLRLRLAVDHIGSVSAIPLAYCRARPFLVALQLPAVRGLGACGPCLRIATPRRPNRSARIQLQNRGPGSKSRVTESSSVLPKAVRLPTRSRSHGAPTRPRATTFLPWVPPR
jgi:hypothetical protein